MQLNINGTSVVQHTNRLEQMHKSALPNAVRNTLNNAVYDVKTKTMLAKSKSEFVNRQKNFFKATSKFENAKGFNVNTMKATIGFVGKGQAIEDLEQQEHGGAIGGRSFVPTEDARQGNSKNKIVRENARITNIKKIINARDIKGRYENFTARQQFSGAAIKAGKDGYVLSGKYLWKINLIIRRERKRIKIYKTKLFNFKKDRSVKVEATHFMEESSMESAYKMERFFIKNANREFNKIRK